MSIAPYLLGIAQSLSALERQDKPMPPAMAGRLSLTLRLLAHMADPAEAARTRAAERAQPLVDLRPYLTVAPPVSPGELLGRRGTVIIDEAATLAANVVRFPARGGEA